MVGLAGLVAQLAAATPTTPSIGPFSTANLIANLGALVVLGGFSLWGYAKVYKRLTDQIDALQKQLDDLNRETRDKTVVALGEAVHVLNDVKELLRDLQRERR